MPPRKYLEERFKFISNKRTVQAYLRKATLTFYCALKELRLPFYQQTAGLSLTVTSSLISYLCCMHYAVYTLKDRIAVFIPRDHNKPITQNESDLIQTPDGQSIGIQLMAVTEDYCPDVGLTAVMGLLDFISLPRIACSRRIRAPRGQLHHSKAFHNYLTDYWCEGQSFAGNGILDVFFATLNIKVKQGTQFIVRRPDRPVVPPSSPSTV